jgi:hypothetical protein
LEVLDTNTEFALLANAHTGALDPPLLATPIEPHQPVTSQQAQPSKQIVTILSS